MSFDWSTTHFPNPSVSYSTKLATTVVRTNMESARVRQRRRFTTGWRTVNVKWDLSDEQWKLFQSVVHHKLSQGADFFDIELPLGDGMQEYFARFVADSIQEQYKQGAVMYWEVSAQLELANVPPMDEAETDAALAALNP